ncbi:MAG: transposase [Tatlockia sp.]|nr:transposase [Tatlockia sp.]
MVNYRRDITSGATYFFTLTLRNRQSNLLTKHITLLGNSFRQARKDNPFLTKAIVVLPEHLHVIWQLPTNDDDYSTRWRQIKTYFTQALIKAKVPLSSNSRNEYNLWQRRFWEHRIRNDQDLEQHVAYIHNNPVKHRLVNLPRDWPYSSIHSYIKQGILSKNWGGDSIEGYFGEVD